MQHRDIQSAGYYSQYLWDQRRDLSKRAGFNVEQVARSLAAFHIRNSYGSTGEFSVPAPQEETTIAVLEGLLRRGLPTLSSVFVEDALLAGCISAGLVTKIEADSGIRFMNLEKERRGLQEWLDALIRAHAVVDPRLDAEEMDPSLLESAQERDFFCRVLPEGVGAGVWQFFEPQRSFRELLPAADAAKHRDERVDLAARLSDLQAIIEIDGYQHSFPPQLYADQRRDADLHKQGWRVTRVLTDDIYEPATVASLKALVPERPFVRAVRQNCHKPLWETAMGRDALRLVLAPFGIARIQAALLLALRQSILSLQASQWRLVVVERDVPCALLALVDFRMQLDALYQLLKLDWDLPDVEVMVYNTPEFAGLDCGVPETVLAQHHIHARQVELRDEHLGSRSTDLMLDISILRRGGYSRMDEGFADAHLCGGGAAFEIRSAYDFQDTRRISPMEPIAYPIDDDSLPALLFWLRNIFRKPGFRDGQFEILRRSLALKPVIGLLPTGAGKSLCYQLSALLQPGMTVVIDPIVSLMIDQVDNMRNVLAVDWIDTIHSWRESEDKTAVSESMSNGRVRILLISPERLQDRTFRNKLSEFSLAYSVPYAIIDEAHCVSEWGHDFRTSYLRLAETMRKYATRHDRAPTVLALTGTASYAVLSDVQREIGVEDEKAQIYPKSFDREELHFRVAATPSSQKQQELYSLMLTTLPQYFDQTNWQTLYRLSGGGTKGGIIFTPHAGGPFGASSVRNALVRKLDTEVGVFFGTQEKEIKAEAQAKFKNNDTAVLVATKAFGMGIDKPNVRYTIHYNIPHSLEAFYQEAGRAGRDRQPAICWLLFSDDCNEEANRALAPDAERSVLAAIGEDYGGGDVHRLLWLHKNTYRGFDADLAALSDMYKTHIGHALKEQPIGRTVEVKVPFDEGGTKQEREKKQQERDKALYRLRLLGLVQDYTLDYKAKHFEVTAAAQTDQQLIANLQHYIGRYKVREVVDKIPDAVNQEPGATILGKCCSYLLRFVYEEIEKKRRAAIRTMVEVARKAAELESGEEQDAFVRNELRSYLEKSPFTDALLALAQRIEPSEWLRVLNLCDTNGVRLLSTVDGVRQLVGGCRRMLESQLEHPGLLFLSSVGRLLLNPPDVYLAEAEERRAIRALNTLSPQKGDAIVTQMLAGYVSALQNVADGDLLYETVASVALDEHPTRPLARRVWPTAEAQVERVLLNLLLFDVRALNERLDTEGNGIS